jgi:hypothetical protein
LCNWSNGGTVGGVGTLAIVVVIAFPSVVLGAVVEAVVGIAVELSADEEPEGSAVLLLIAVVMAGEGGVSWRSISLPVEVALSPC